MGDRFGVSNCRRRDADAIMTGEGNVRALCVLMFFLFFFVFRCRFNFFGVGISLALFLSCTVELKHLGGRRDFGGQKKMMRLPNHGNAGLLFRCYFRMMEPEAKLVTGVLLSDGRGLWIPILSVESPTLLRRTTIVKHSVSVSLLLLREMMRRML